ncbi:MAG: hypothetical protein ABSE91_00370 [Patescibacteria group bacterium]|jgi:hypothetical protein
MTITPHLLTGAAIVANTKNIPLGLTLAFFSHFVLDALPHLDPGTFHNQRQLGYQKVVKLEEVHRHDRPWPLWIYLFVILEFIFAWILVVVLFYGRPNFGWIILGGFLGMAVDILDNPVFYPTLSWPVLKQIHYLHHRVHYNLDPKKWYWGLLSEVIIIAGSLWLIFK